jgi:hypothetical protein
VVLLLVAALVLVLPDLTLPLTVVLPPMRVPPVYSPA